MIRKIVFAGGCFWGVEAYLSKITGVVNTCVGYANGNTGEPTYKEVCSDKTGYAEACLVEYDEALTTLSTLLEHYWRIIDPTQLNRQGHDVGNQYRTGVYYYDTADRDIIIKSKEAEQLSHNKRIVTEIEPLKNFYAAEEYHQKYLVKNPEGYCHIPRELLNR